MTTPASPNPKPKKLPPTLNSFIAVLNQVAKNQNTLTKRMADIMATLESFQTDLGTLATSVTTLIGAYNTLKDAAANGVPLTQTQLDALDQTVQTVQGQVNALNIPAPTPATPATPAQPA